MQLLKHFYSKDINEPVSAVSYPLFAFVLIVFSSVILVLSLKYLPQKYFLYVTLICYLIMAVGYMSKKDPELKWEGSDVALYNYAAGEETAMHGAFYIIETWNCRANPYVEAGFSSEFTDLILKKYSEEFLKKISGDKWVVKDNLNVDLSNNRPYMHPPVAPVLIGLWLKMFPYGRMSVQIFMLLLNVVLIVLLYKAINKITGSNYLPLVLSFVFSPVFTLYIQPSAEQITLLLLFSSILIYLKSNNIVSLVISGIFAGFAFYSKFIVIIFIFVFLIGNLFYFKGLGKFKLLYYLSGVIAVIIFFTLSGYYFWLTIITGQAMAKLFTANNPVTLTKTLSTFLYFGIPVMLFVSLNVINTNYFKIKDKHQLIFVVTFVTAIIYIFMTFEVATFNRYLIVFIPALLLGAAKYIRDFKFGFKETALIAVSNVLLLLLIIYL